MTLAGAAISLLAFASPQGDALDAYMRQLAIAANVQVMNGVAVGPNLDANAQFDFNVQTRWDYSIAVIRRSGQLELVVEPKFTFLDVKLKHMLRLPQENPGTERYRTLLLHEYDHVAISTDERARLLLAKLIQSIGAIRKPWGSGAIPPPDSQVNTLISSEIESRKAAVVKLVLFAYERLDKLTDHGRKPFADRAQFAGWLYSPSHFKEAGFPFFKEADVSLSSAEGKAARRWFRL